MEALPALRELQLQTKRRNEAIDLMVHPEKIVPPHVRLTGQPRSIVTGNGVLRENIVVPYQMPYQAPEAIRAEIDKCKEQVDTLFYADLFNAITNMRGIQPRNMEEIAKRNEEKLTQLGPVIERVSVEKLTIVIERVFGLMERGRMLPPAPAALRDADIKVEFVSILTQMQRLVGIGQIERSVGAAQVPRLLRALQQPRQPQRRQRRRCRLGQLEVPNVFEVWFGGEGGMAYLDAGVTVHTGNKRTQMWTQMRAWLKLGAIPENQQLQDDLVGPTYAFGADETSIVLEKKKDMKKRGLASPDEGDALACTFAFPVLPRAVPNYLNPENYGQPAGGDRYDELA